jgi:hypothetical protein
MRNYREAPPVTRLVGSDRNTLRRSTWLPDALESCLYLLRDRLRAARRPAPRAALGSVG